MIINGWKYDTETSLSLFRIFEDEVTTITMYQNSKLAFFKYTVKVINKESCKISEKIEPVTKMEVQHFLLSENQVDKYEEIFGEVREAEGEDYISEEMAFEIEKSIAVNAAIENSAIENDVIEKENNNTKPKVYKYSFFDTQKLIWYCGTNNIEKARKAIQNGADCNYKKSACLNKAIVSKNTELVKLLIESGSKLSDNAVKLAFAIGSTELIKYLCELAPINKDVLLFGIEKSSLRQDVKTVTYLMKLLTQNKENEINEKK